MAEARAWPKPARQQGLLKGTSKARALANARASDMRLDLFLKASRLCSRRTIAQKICEASRVSVNGSPAKSSHAVKAGDEILIRRHDKLTTLRVLYVPTARQTSRKDAGTLYEVMSEESLDGGEL